MYMSECIKKDEENNQKFTQETLNISKRKKNYYYLKTYFFFLLLLLFKLQKQLNRKMIKIQHQWKMMMMIIREGDRGILAILFL